MSVGVVFGKRNGSILFSRTAMRTLTLLESVPVDCLLGYPKFVRTTRACTSVSMGRVPSMEQVTTDPLDPSGLPLSMYSDGLRNLCKAFISHLEDPDLICGAEAVLDAPQDPVGGISVPSK